VRWVTPSVVIVSPFFLELQVYKTIFSIIFI
jgi:hypothetical protein